MRTTRSQLVDGTLAHLPTLPQSSDSGVTHSSYTYCLQDVHYINIATITELQEQQLVACFMLGMLQCTFSLNQSNVDDYIKLCVTHYLTSLKCMREIMLCPTITLSLATPLGRSNLICNIIKLLHILVICYYNGLVSTKVKSNM